jgi:hypothetical protein
MVKQATEKYEPGEFTCQRVDEVPALGDRRALHRPKPRRLAGEGRGVSGLVLTSGPFFK